jgi:predicted DNA-binding helix-hairpin-helix protein
MYADRLSVNLEIPTNPELKRLAPEKNHLEIYQPMSLIKTNILKSKEERRKYRNAPNFSPAGQSTQLIVGASPETDQQILSLSTNLYNEQKLKRVYFSGYLPVNEYDQRLPALKTPPLVRENRFRN